MCTLLVLRYHCRHRDRNNNPPSASAAFEAFGCRCPVFLVLAPACAALTAIEVWVAALNLVSTFVEAHSHAESSFFRRIRL
jgi:hypothetical protein